MPNIQPFAAYRYNLGRVGDISEVVAPPYDVIDPKFQDELYEKHPNNVIRLILNKQNPQTDTASDNRYTRSAKSLKEWKDQGILVQEAKAAIYVYHQIFKDGDVEHVRKGFLCRCEALPFGQGLVFPHEQTMSGPKLDRLMLTTACKMNFSPVFGLYPDDSENVQALLDAAVAKLGEPPIEATDHLGVLHRMWTITDSDVLSKLVAEMGQKPIFIADGHHRYETACNYKRQIADMGMLTNEHPANYVLMMCVAMHDSGLIVQPTHRLFTDVPKLTAEELANKLADCFTIEEFPADGPEAAAALWEELETDGRQDRFGLYTGADKKWSIASLTEAGKAKMDAVAESHHPEWRDLGVSILQSLIVGHLLQRPEPKNTVYLHDISEVAAELTKNPDSYPLCVLVKPASVQHIRELSLLGERMPAKSTYFYPKLISGFVFNPLDV